MQNAPGPRAAKEFLIHCIVEEAQREGTPLSDIERDMLYFSETCWTLPNILEMNEAFERQYNSADYERKIAQIIHNFKTRAASDDPATLETWNNSVHALESEDHYILVMIGIAAGRMRPLPTQTSGPRRALKLLAVGIIAGIAALLIMFVILFIARR